jgi:hypothetical protein
MNRFEPRLRRDIGGLAAGLVIALSALAEAGAAEPLPAADLARTAPGTTGLGRPVGRDVLARLRGGDDIDNQADIHGEVTGNTAIGVRGGGNAVAGRAFSGSAGINTLIQNTGTNVLIQNALVVNVRFGEGP